MPGLNLFKDILKADARKIFGELEKGEHEVDLPMQRGTGKSTARVQWMQEPDWLVVEIEKNIRRACGARAGSRDATHRARAACKNVRLLTGICWPRT